MPALALALDHSDPNASVPPEVVVDDNDLAGPGLWKLPVVEENGCWADGNAGVAFTAGTEVK